MSDGPISLRQLAALNSALHANAAVTDSATPPPADILMGEPDDQLDNAPPHTVDSPMADQDDEPNKPTSTTSPPAPHPPSASPFSPLSSPAPLLIPNPSHAHLKLLALTAALERHLHFRAQLLSLQPALSALTASLTSLRAHKVAKPVLTPVLRALSWLAPHYALLEHDASRRPEETWLAAVRAALASFPSPVAEEYALDPLGTGGGGAGEVGVAAGTAAVLDAVPAVLRELNDAQAVVAQGVGKGLKVLDAALGKLGGAVEGEQGKKYRDLKALGIGDVLTRWGAAFEPVWRELGGYSGPG